MNKTFLPLFFAILLFASCATQKPIRIERINRLTFIGQYTLPHKMQVNGTTLGGLSGIDYNPSKKEYYLICDDRSDINPLRFYTIKIDFSENGIENVRPEKATSFTANGKLYHNRKQDSLNVPDPEALRFHPKTGEIFWSSEGERTVKKDHSILTNPLLSISTLSGALKDTLPLPPNMRMSAAANGPRNNGVFEGLCFSPDYKTLFVSVEEPLYEDGPRAGLYDSSAWVRIIQYDVASKKPVAQYAYKIDPVVQEPISEGLFVVNGVTDILAINDHQLLVTERSFSTGRLGNNIRTYIAELTGAQNVAGITSLQQTPPQAPLKKIPLLNFDTLGILVDNVEGASFGPRLANGKRSLIFVTDDNFSAQQKTQFLLFAIEE